MKTMGHSDLVLVNPSEEYLGGKAMALAHNSGEILQNAKVYSDFSEAIEGEKIDLVVGCTARHRKQIREYVDCRKLQEFLYDRHRISARVAIVFGTESTGLTNSEIELCDVLTSIPTASVQPSLNLSQAVMIYSFLLSQSSEVQTRDWRLEKDIIKEQEYIIFKDSVSDLLLKLGLKPTDNVYRKALLRIPFIPGADLRLLQFIKRKISDLV